MTEEVTLHVTIFSMIDVFVYVAIYKDDSTRYADRFDGTYSPVSMPQNIFIEMW